MDFDGSALNKFYNADNRRGTQRKTSDVYALATAVLFQSAVQHFALAPNNLEDAPDWAIDFLKKVPTTWDEVRFIDGYPGKYIVLARRSGTKWYVAGVCSPDAVVRDRNGVAEPLKLKRSGFFQPLDEELIENAAFGGRLAEKEDPARGFHYYPEHAAAGFWTTPTELTKIGIALSKNWREGGLLKQETARRMLTPVMDSYGLGIQSFRGDIGYHDGWNEGFLTTWMFSLREDLCVAVMFNRSTDELDWAQTNIAIELFQTLEVELAEDAGVDKSGWEAFCGKYEQNDEKFRIDEICLEQEKLWAKVLTEEGEQRYALYPIGEKTFGRKGGFAKIVFGDNCLTIDETTCKKL
jgi:hypothetical protein